jgi:hypothetical protein
MYVKWEVCRRKIKISQQPENWENRNDPDFVQVFSKKWWVESDFTATNLPLDIHIMSILSAFTPEPGS